MNKTKITTCDLTWNPILGCRHDCEYCYARRITERFRGDVRAYLRSDQLEQTMHIDKESGMAYMTYVLEQPFKDQNEKVVPFPTGFEPTFLPFRLDEPQKKAKPRTIFTCSMADMFGDWVPDEWIEEVFMACEEAPQHRYLFLTKNPQRYVELAKTSKLPKRQNMWYGTTATAPDELFFWGEGWNTFVSVEPLLGDYSKAGGNMCKDYAQWVIVGAETGRRHNKVVPEREWVEAIIKECTESGIPLYMKDSLIPIVGEKNMHREFPWDELGEEEET